MLLAAYKSSFWSISIEILDFRCSLVTDSGPINTMNGWIESCNPRVPLSLSDMALSRHDLDAQQHSSGEGRATVAQLIFNFPTIDRTGIIRRQLFPSPSSLSHRNQTVPSIKGVYIERNCLLEQPSRKRGFIIVCGEHHHHGPIHTVDSRHSLDLIPLDAAGGLVIKCT